MIGITAQPERGLSRGSALAVVAVVLCISAWVGRRNAPTPANPRAARWYRGLSKPAFTPSAPIFGAAWPMLEAGAALGGYRLLRRPASLRRDVAVAMWLGTSAMIGGWTELFFGRRLLGPSAATVGAMTVASLTLVCLAEKVDRPASWSVVPLTIWMAFATVLSEEIWRRNERPARCPLR